MIKTVVIESQGSSQKTTTVLCDTCHQGVSWGPGKVSRTVSGAYAKFLLRKEGWKFGKKHTCPKCKAHPRS